MATAAAPETAMATSDHDQQRGDQRQARLGRVARSMPRPCMANRLAKTPIMKISEWAKLISRSTP